MTIRFVALLLFVLLLQLLVGCSVKHVTTGIYEGFRVQNDLQSSPAERVGRPESPDYGQYEQMKKEQNY